MEKKKLKFILLMISLATSPFVFAQDEIDPPPTAPIDDYIPVVAIGTVLLGIYIVYKRNFKTETK